MIKVNIKRNADRTISGYTVAGHAEYDEPGKDIVCAGVSAIVVGTANAIEKLLQTEVESTMDKGLLKVSIPEWADPSDRDKAQWVLEAMIVMLQTIQASYGDYITMQDSSK